MNLHFRISSDIGDDHGSLQKWIQYLQQSAQKVEEAMANANIHEWIPKQKSRARKLLLKTFRAADGRWTQAVLYWKPEIDNMYARRQRGGQFAKWSQQFEDYDDLL